MKALNGPAVSDPRARRRYEALSIPKADLLFQCDQANVRRLEATGVEIERHEMWIEVYMQPFVVGHPCMDDSFLDQGLRNSLALESGIDHGVQNKGVHSPIPRHIHEPDQLC